MPDVTELPHGLNEYSCGRCGRALKNPRELYLKIDAANLFGNAVDFLLICRQCGEQLFPRTSIFEREDCQ